MHPDRLSNLPVELIYEILSSIDSTKDLFQCLRACPAIYAVFRDRKNSILRRVVINGFEPSSLPAAITASRFPNANYSHAEGVTAKEEEEARKFNCSRSDRLAELIRSEGGHRRPELSDSVRLARLLTSFEAFIPDCGGQFLAMADLELARKSHPSLKPKKKLTPLSRPISLSATERGRFQRAFVRYATFSSLVHYPMWTSEVAPPWDTYAKALFPFFTAWEIEEIACIHDYVLRWLRSMTDDLADDFVESVRTAEGPRKYRFIAYDKAGKLRDIDCWRNQDLFVEDEDSDSDSESPLDKISWPYCGKYRTSDKWMFLQGESIYQVEQIAQLESLPPKVFRALLQATSRQRRRIIKAYFNIACFNSVMQPLRVSSDSCLEEQRIKAAGKWLAFKLDLPGKRNLAWLWAHQNGPCSRADNMENIVFRSWGYVFWDRGRLQDMKLLQDSPIYLDFASTPMEQLAYEPTSVCGWFPKSRNKLTAHERLKKLGLA